MRNVVNVKGHLLVGRKAQLWSPVFITSQVTRCRPYEFVMVARMLCNDCTMWPVLIRWAVHDSFRLVFVGLKSFTTVYLSTA